MVAGVPLGNNDIFRRSLFHGLPVALLVTALLTYWFGIADRYIVFLYNHDMGAVVPDTSPFSRVTSSRYWIAGLVASGFVLVLYTSAIWLAGRLRRYALPPWNYVWLVCAPILIIAVPAITMGLNTPTLPWYFAAAVTIVTLAGVALALIPGKLAAERPWDLVWLAADGWGLALIVTILAQMDDIGRWMASGIDWRVLLSLVVLALSAGWLLLLTVVRYWRGVIVGDFVSLAVATACVAYLFLPLMHYVLGTDGYYYITDSDNFMAGSLTMQLLAWLVTAFLIWALLALLKKLSQKSIKP